MFCMNPADDWNVTVCQFGRRKDIFHVFLILENDIVDRLCLEEVCFKIMNVGRGSSNTAPCSCFFCPNSHKIRTKNNQFEFSALISVTWDFSLILEVLEMIISSCPTFILPPFFSTVKSQRPAPPGGISVYYTHAPVCTENNGPAVRQEVVSLTRMMSSEGDFTPGLWFIWSGKKGNFYCILVLRLWCGARCQGFIFVKLIWNHCDNRNWLHNTKKKSF